MNRKLNRGTAVATLVAGAALAVAVVGGGAAVAGGYAKDSIASRHIKDGAVRSGDIADNAVTGAKVADGSLTGADVMDGSMGGGDVMDGSLTGADVKDDSITGAHIDEDSLDTVQLAEAAKVADNAHEADTAEIARSLLGLARATFRADGSLIDQEGANIIDAQQTSTPGRYVITLQTPQLGCLMMASVTHNGTERVVGSASVWRKGPIPETFGRFLVVETNAPDGNDTPDPMPFGLLTVC